MMMTMIVTMAEIKKTLMMTKKMKVSIRREAYIIHRKVIQR